MKVPLSWLKEFVNINISINELAETLTLAGLEVEKIETIGNNFKGVVVAKVLSTIPHPQADKLRIATVFDGHEELQIVCGASNCRANIKVALAKIGAELPGEDGKPFQIKKAKLRSVESFGMLCSGKELGVSGEAEGIIELDDSLLEGTNVSELYADTILDIALTPNLGHCMSILGIAREIAALTDTKAIMPLKRPSEDPATSTKNFISIIVDDQTNYSCRLIQDVQVTPSPEWLKKRLELIGVRSINNLVDIANLVMFECGQPLHVFDYDLLNKKTIHVTSVKSETPIKTLDGQEHLLIKGDLIISDDVRPLAIAGIIGGEDSAVNDRTRNILIESAHFDPKTIRKTMKRLGLRTDASQRFEKNIDPLMVDVALDRVASLIQECSGGKVAKGIISKNNQPYKPHTVACRAERTSQLIGFNFTDQDIITLLARLEINLHQQTGSTLYFTIPSYRNDLTEEIDLVEEVNRLHGFNNIPAPQKGYAFSPLPNDNQYTLEDILRHKLLEENLQEWLTCNLISPKLNEIGKKGLYGEMEQIHVLCPGSIDQSIMRSSLLPSFLQIVQINENQKNFNLSAFEIGSVHFKNDNQYIEKRMAGILMCGKNHPYHYNPKPIDLDFFDLKGCIENILYALRIKNIRFEASKLSNLHPFRQAHIYNQNNLLGIIGEVHPTILQTMDLSQKVFFAELDIGQLSKAYIKIAKVEPLPLYPTSERDWTITLGKDQPIQTIIDLILRNRGKFLTDVFLLDLYEGEKTKAGEKNATFRLIYRDDKETISLETVEREHTKILSQVTAHLEK